LINGFLQGFLQLIHLEEGVNDLNDLLPFLRWQLCHFAKTPPELEVPELADLGVRSQQSTNGNIQ
jgi:hypothetical protein